MRCKYYFIKKKVYIVLGYLQQSYFSSLAIANKSDHNIYLKNIYIYIYIFNLVGERYVINEATPGTNVNPSIKSLQVLQISRIGEIDCPTQKRFNSQSTQNPFRILERILSNN